MVLDDAVVHHADAVVGDVRMGIARAGGTMRGPARMRDPGVAGQWIGGEQAFQLAHLALRACAPEAVAGFDEDTGGIVSAVLQRLQAIDQDGDDITPAAGRDDSAHVCSAVSVWGWPGL